MHLKDYIKRHLDFPAGAERQAELESIFADDLYTIHVKMGVVILLFEALMIATTLLRGGPWPVLRGMLYFGLYVALFCATLVFLVCLISLRRSGRERAVTMQIRLSAGFGTVLCLWSCFLTLLDQHSGPNLNVYSYILMATSVFCTLKPIQSILLYGCEFLLLNGAAFALQDSPVFFSGPLQAYNILINSLFMAILATIISITLYRYRVNKKHDRTVINAINQQLIDQAMTDQLTAVGNRRYLEEQLGRLRTLQPAPGEAIAGMMLDIDFFKQYNDNFGHQAGDQCLRELAQLLRDFAQEEDGFVVRYGGEEFFLCLPRCRDALGKAESLRQRILDRRLARNDLPLGCVTVSIGVDVQTDCSAIQQDTFLRRCDEALYTAKNAGRNQVCLFGS